MLVAKSAEDQNTKLAGFDRDVLSGLWDKNEKIKKEFSNDQQLLLGEVMAEMLLQAAHMTNLKELAPMKVEGAGSSSSEIPVRVDGLAAAVSVAQSKIGDIPSAEQQKAHELVVAHGLPNQIAGKPATKRDTPSEDEDAMQAEALNKVAKK